MLLSAGTRIGPYEIAAPLGAGGMGEVYRARDPRLNREVALKVLRADVADRRRFTAEAHAASSLNHPNIVSIYDIGEEDGSPYIVFELIDGVSLREQLAAASPMPVRKLLDIAVQIASGLSAAHARDITHRDLKPENIMILRDGQVKILDFGLAKSPEPVNGDSETRTAHGVLLGTVAYMSPEQAQGSKVDFRSDQFSFGAVLYEMAVGAPAFRRADRVSTLSAVVREEPPSLSAISPPVPAPVRWVVERCLAKEPAQRYASTADLYHQLRDTRDHLSEVFTSDASLAGIAPPRRTPFLSWSLRAAVAIFLLGAGLATGIMLMRPKADPRTYRFTPFAAEAADETEPAWSPDGKALAYTAVVGGVAQVFARRLDSLMAAQLTSDTAACRYPFWSADGSRIYYWSASTLWSVAAAGGDPQEVLRNVTTAFPPATISPDGRTLAFFRSEGPHQLLQLMPFPNGTPSAYAQPPFPAKFRFTGGIRFSPDGRKLLVWLTRDFERGTEVWVLPYPAGPPRQVPLPLLTGYRNVTASWAADSRHIALAVQPKFGAGGHIYFVDTATARYEQATTGTGEEREPAFSPDGERLAFASGGSASNLLEASVDGTSMVPLLANPRHHFSPDWAPSGWQFTYISDASGVPEIWIRSTSEGWSMPVIRESPEGELAYASPRFSPDGQRLAYVRTGSKHLIWVSNLSGGVAAPIEQESPDQHGPAWSPDGHWLAYVRYVDTKWQLAKAPSGGGARPVPIADGGIAASKVEWSPAGDQICFSEGGDVRAVPSSGGGSVLVTKGAASFTFARDGASMYVVRRDPSRKWELVPVTVPGGVEGKPIPLKLPEEAIVTAARLHPDGKRLVLAVSTWNRDIWILDGLQKWGRRP